MMNGTLIFLHGFGYDHTQNQKEIEYLCGKIGYVPLFIDSEFSSNRERGGKARYPITIGDHKHMLDTGEFESSLDRIEREIQNIAKTSPDHRIVLCGRSQGGIMTLASIERFGELIDAGILFCSYLPNRLEINKKTKPIPPLFRLEGGKDRHINDSKKSSYKQLEHCGRKTTHLLDPESTHDHFTMEGMDLLANHISSEN